MPNTVDSPSPVPLPFCFVVKNGSNTRARRCVHAHARVGHGDHHVGPGRHADVRSRVVLVEFDVLGFDRHVAAHHNDGISHLFITLDANVLRERDPRPGQPISRGVGGLRLR